MASKRAATRPSPSKPARGSYAKAAEETAARQRTIQAGIDASDKRKPVKAKDEDEDKKNPVQAGPRKQPQNPMPKQHLRKPGNEYELKLQPQPRFLAPDYRGSGKLEGMAALITGGDSGIGRAVAVLFAREGADVAIAYLDEHEDAAETLRHVEKEGRRCLAIAGDVRDSGSCDAAEEATFARQH